MAAPTPESIPELLSAQLAQRTTVILSMTASWSPSQAMVNLHPGGPCGHNTLQHLIEVTYTTLAALELEIPLRGSGESWPDLKERFETVSGKLAEQVCSLSPADLEEAPSIELLPEFKESLTNRQVFLMGHVFHLAYHAGQLGSLAALLSRSTPA
ncbi:MAG: hypothetical protein ACI87O_000632 [Planctomycetota bacterium]|jgi:hypothetical protein